MDSVLTLQKQFENWAFATERSLATWLNPSMDFDARVTKGWALTRLDHVIYVLLAYAVVVAIGLARYTPPKEEVKKEKGNKGSLIQLFAAEPIKILQVVYNLTQVGLCAWMMYAAATEAYDQRYPLVCAEFNPASTRIARVEWVFYLSKVRHHTLCRISLHG